MAELTTADLTETTTTSFPTLRARADSERAHIARVEDLSTEHTWLVAWQPEPPIVAGALRQLAADSRWPTPALGT